VDGYFFNVGNDSCRGQAACSYLGSNSTVVRIANGSCKGYYACYDNSATIAEKSW
jgi:uncharacterized CHY-type Zn-finger protein